MFISLAPMEGVVDHIVRDLWTRIGGIDHCVTEFVRVTDRLLPEHVFHKYCPELLANRGYTAAGTPVFLQLLGGQPKPMAENALRVFSLGAPGLDLNFGCPAKTVNRHDGGAALLKHPERLYNIISEIRKTVPKTFPVTAKVRLGFEDKSLVKEISQAVSDGGADRLTVHARTKIEGYKPPAHWEFIAMMKEVSSVPVIANGDIWNVDDYIRCREISGCNDVALGRTLMARPDLALAIKSFCKTGSSRQWDWQTALEHTLHFHQTNMDLMSEIYATRRIKQYLKMLAKAYPEAKQVFEQIKRLQTAEEIKIGIKAFENSHRVSAHAASQGYISERATEMSLY